MFRFHNPYEYEHNPFASGYRAPQPRQPQYRRGGAPYEDLFGGGLHPSDYRYAQQQEEHRRQQLLEQRRRQEEQERRARAKKELEAKEAKRRELLAKATRAATVIQRAVRAYLVKVRVERARARAEREDWASRQIVRVVRFVAAVKEARGIADSLRRLRTIDGAIKTEFEAFKQHPCGYRNTLRFGITIEKHIISLDSVPRRRSTFVQERRRAMITEAQRALHYADLVQKMLVSKATVVQRATRRFLGAKNQMRLECAAKIILRVLRAAPKIRHARKVAAQLRDVRTQTKVLDHLRSQYMQALRDARAATMAAASTATPATSGSDVLSALATALAVRVDRELSGLESKAPALSLEREVAASEAAVRKEECSMDQAAEPHQDVHLEKHKKKRGKKNRGKTQ